MPARCASGCPEGASAKDATAFNTHSPGGGGSGLAQHVFRSPARIPATESRTARRVRRAAKRKTLYDIAPMGWFIEFLQWCVSSRACVSPWTGFAALFQSLLCRECPACSRKRAPLNRTSATNLGSVLSGIAIHLELLVDLGIGHLVGGECQSGRSCQPNHPSAAAENFIFTSP
jgi:hypothetical protein